MAGADPTIFLLSIFIAPIVALLISKLWIYGKKNGNSKLPPGDMGWPIVGSTFSLFKPHPATSLSDFVLLQISRYGKIFSTRFLGETVVVSADAEFNRFVLQNEMRLFQNDLPSHFKNLLGESSMSFATGEDYRRKKSRILGFLNSCQIETRLLVEVEEAAERVMNSWKHKNLILANEEISKFVLSVAIRKTMGMSPDDPEAEELRKAFITLNAGLYSVPLNLPFTRYSKALKARDIILSIAKRKAEDRKLNIDKMDDKENDLVRYCLKEYPSMSMQQICESIVGFIFAALFNTQITIELAMYFLKQYPKSLQQLRAEFKQKVKDSSNTKKPTWDEYKNMEFCQSVINETLRLGNLIPGLWRRTLSDISFKGYTIPQGTKVMTNFAAVHLDQSAFENPNIFDPWRWLTLKKSNNLMSFGGGVRHCSGSEFARIEITVFLRHIVLGYDWEPAEADHPVAFPMVSFPKGYPIIIHPLEESTP